MQAIFRELSEQNKDIVIMIAKCVTVEHGTFEESSSHQTTEERLC